MTLIEVACAKILARVEQKQISIRGALEDYLKVDPSIRPVRDVVLALCLGTVRNYVLLDYLVKHVTGLETWRLPLFERYLVRVLTYEIKYRDCDLQRTERALKYCKRVNIDLRTLLRIRDVDPNDIVSNLDTESRLHVLYSVPRWLVRYMLSVFGIEETENMLRAFNQRAPLYIRVNISRVSREELLRRLRSRGVDAYPDDDLDDIILVKKLNVGLESLPEYRSGLFYIQDKASALVGHVVKLLTRRYSRVLDACSAPGGKAMHLQELVKCYVVAADVSYRRILTERNLVKRYLYTDIDLICSNMIKPPLKRVNIDVIVLDPDCTSLGKLAHSPEVRLWIRRHHINEYARHQFKLASSLIRNVNFTHLVYSTCTITLEENEHLIKKLCDEFGLELVDLSERFSKFSSRFLPGTLRAFPHVHRTCGYFVAALRRVN